LLEDRLAHEKLSSRFDLLPINCSNTRLVAGVNATSQRQAPGCALFFLKDHPRRERCNPACGNRVRAARAYRKQTQPCDRLTGPNAIATRRHRCAGPVRCDSLARPQSGSGLLFLWHPFPTCGAWLPSAGKIAYHSRPSTRWADGGLVSSRKGCRHRRDDLQAQPALSRRGNGYRRTEDLPVGQLSAVPQGIPKRLIVDLLIEGIDGVRCGFASGHPGALGCCCSPEAWEGPTAAHADPNGSRRPGRAP